jgi:uncharacterized small protein (DUF1192 family)
MVNESSTKEQVSDYISALESEKVGYVARIANAKSGRQERLEVGQLEDRIKQVDAEAKRAKALIGKKDKSDDAGDGGKGKGKGKGTGKAADAAEPEAQVDEGADA